MSLTKNSAINMTYSHFNIPAFLLILCLSQPTFSQAQDPAWRAIDTKILTPWAADVDPQNPLPAYPRPQLVRPNWQNLNGLWQYRIQEKDQAQPQEYQGQILVPFAVESALSGVGQRVGNDSVLWYQTTFTTPSMKRGKRVLLHFGAVDWEAQVYLNGQEVGNHRGGYDPFSFDITEQINGKDAQELVVRVWDPTDDGPQPRGKQINQPERIWYTPVTGIWQTVWLEVVPDTYIASTKNTPNLDASSFTVGAQVDKRSAR